MDNASPALHAALSLSFPSLRGVAPDTCHLPEKYEAVASHHGSAGSRMLRRLVSKFNVSFPSKVCPEMDALEPFRGEGNWQFTGDEVFFYERLCRASLSREHIDAADTSMKSAEVWLGLAEWIRALPAVATLYPEEMKNKHFWKAKSRLRVLVDGGCDFPEVPVVLEPCSAPLDGGVPAGGPAGHQDTR